MNHYASPICIFRCDKLSAFSGAPNIFAEYQWEYSSPKVPTITYLVNIDLNGATFPLVRAGTLQDARQFALRARHWSGWDWLFRLSRRDAWLELRRNAKDHCSQFIPGLAPVAMDDMSIWTYMPPSDSEDLQDWADSIFFGYKNPLVRWRNTKLVEYANEDFSIREFSTPDSDIHPHIKNPDDTIVVDFDGNINDLKLGNIPPPSAILINPINNHAHLWWRCDGTFRGKGIQWAKDITRGLANKLSAQGADAHPHQMTKNPRYPGWKIVRNDDHIYNLKELDSVLTKADKYENYVPNSCHYPGKNPRLFNRLRFYAYTGFFVSNEDCAQYLYEIANETGTEGLPDREVREVCWYIAIGEERGKWPDWASKGKKRRTYFRHKKHGVPSRGKGRPPSYTNEQKEKVLELYMHDELPFRRIAIETGIDKSVVYNIIKKSGLQRRAQR